MGNQFFFFERVEQGTAVPSVETTLLRFELFSLVFFFRKKQKSKALPRRIKLGFVGAIVLGRCLHLSPPRAWRESPEAAMQAQQMGFGLVAWRIHRYIS